MRLPGFTAGASLNMAGRAYRALASRDTLDQTGTHKAGSIESAADCNSLRDCCAQCPPGMRGLCDCCIQYQLQRC